MQHVDETYYESAIQTGHKSKVELVMLTAGCSELMELEGIAHNPL